MTPLILLAAIITVACSQSNFEERERKYHENKATTFNKHLIPFNARLALEANYYTKGHFIISAHSVWYTLAPFAESLSSNKKELFELLNLPDEDSERNSFYGTAFSLEGFTDGISFLRSSAIAADETIDGEGWETEILGGLPEYLPLARFDKPFGEERKYKYLGSVRNLPYSGHTVLVDHLIIDGSWNSEFSEKPVQRGLFYNNQGEPIATVEYLSMKSKVRVANFPSNVKVLEIPIGCDGIRSMIFAVGDTAEALIEAVFSRDIFSELKLTEQEIDVVIPRLLLSSGIDMGAVFKDMKSSKLFSNPAVIRKSPDEPAIPLGYFQTVSVNITDSVGREASRYQNDSNSEIDFTALEDSFVVNKPFLFSLFVSHYYTDIKSPVFTGMFSCPGEQGQKRIFD